MPMFLFRLLFVLWLALPVAACGQPQWQASAVGTVPPRLLEDRVISDDGHVLPLHRWMPEKAPVQAVALGLHGFGDYGASFEALSGSLAEAGVALYAFDQRGFGATGQPGIWAGSERMVADVALVTELLRELHPELPVYLIGKSMGGAIAMLAVTREPAARVDGAVYIAPAVWARDTMPWYQRAALWLMLRIRPGMYLSGNTVRDLGIRPTDDPEVVRAMSRDPLVQKRARIDTIYGLTSLMGDALDASARLRGPALILYGGEDHVIPPRPVCAMLGRLPDNEASDWRMVFYPDGYHMLTRYTGAAVTHVDVAQWLLDPSAPLPSGRELDQESALTRVCGGIENGGG
jgi:acylglycerol lipase